MSKAKAEPLLLEPVTIKDSNYYFKSPPMSSKLNLIMATTLRFPTGEESDSISSKRSTPSTDTEDEYQGRNIIESVETNLSTVHVRKSPLQQKMSTGSDDTSYSESRYSEMSTSSDSSYPSTADADRNLDLESDFRKMSMSLEKLDDIIEKIKKIQLTQNCSKMEAKGSKESNGLEKMNDSKTEILSSGANLEDVNSNYPNYRLNVFEECEERNPAYEYNIRSEDENCNNCKSDDDDDDDDDDGLVERGPVRSQSHPSRDKPYCTLQWLTRDNESLLRDDADTLDYDRTAKQILTDKQYREKINPCLDKLSDMNSECKCVTNNTDTLFYGDSTTDGRTDFHASMIGSSTQNTDTSAPSIVFNSPGEATLLEILAQGGFQAAQVFSDTASNSVSSPAMNNEIWPDSPSSTYNVITSRPSSRSSSCAQSPGSATNVGSPPLMLNIANGSMESSSQITSRYRVPQGLSSSASSASSYSNTSSPANYQNPMDQRIEEQLSLVEEVIRNQEVKGEDTAEEMQVVPTLPSLLPTVYEIEGTIVCRGNDDDLVPNNRKTNSRSRAVENTFATRGEGKQEQGQSCSDGPKLVQQSDLTRLENDCSNCVSTGTIISEAQNSLVYPTLEEMLDFSYTSIADYATNASSSAQSCLDFETTMEHLLGSNFPVALNEEVLFFQEPTYQDISSQSQQHVLSSRANDSSSADDDFGRSSVGQPRNKRDIVVDRGSRTSLSPVTENRHDHWQAQAPTTFDDFQIPESVSDYRIQCSKRNPARSIAPWPSLNLPTTVASKRLQEGLDPKDVERAMKNLLKKSIEELARADEDGDTMLMCLVGNPEELEKKKAYLAPLVERLGNVRGALSTTNNRGEDALYLAAMNCPRLAYVTGYLAAAMLRKGIDITQKLYQTKGDTLVHAVAAKGDSHGQVLAELLSLKTAQGNSAFDLSKCNYDGRTALHVAVESHDPAGTGVNSIGTIRLLLENGANPKVKETKCGDTALHMAVSLSCDPALVKALLDKNGCEAVNVTNYNNNTPVHMAAAVSTVVTMERQTQVCWHLIHAGGQTNIQNRQGKMPLALVSPERKEVIRKIFHKKS